MCRKVPDKACDPGMKGCTLSGRFLFTTPEKNISRQQKEKAANKLKQNQEPKQND